jgi:signal transduction histidine kinase/ligand-binding sensor domain-containing protein
MRKYFFVILLVSFQLFFSSINAQLKSSNITVYPELEGTFIYDIITDRQGVVWIATSNGLMQYDGYEYKHYDVDPKDPKTMGSILTYKLFEARDGHIWIGCTDLLSEYNPDTKTFKNYTIAKLTGFPLGSILVLLTINEDLAGRIYFGVLNTVDVNNGTHSIFYKDKNKEQLQSYDPLNKVEIKSVYQATTDLFGTIWIIATNGFFRIDKNRNIYKEKWPLVAYQTDKNNTSIKSDAKGNIWITSSNDIHSILSVWNPSNGKIKSYSLKQSNDKEPLYLNEIEFDAAGNLWIGTNKGLGYFDLKKQQFQLLKDSEDQKMTKADIVCLHLDSFDNLWMGTPSMGLLKYSKKAELKSYVYKKEDKNSITSGWLSKMFESGDGKIWMITEAGIDVFDPVKNFLTPYPIAKEIPGAIWANGIGLYSPEEILFNTNLGLFLFNTNNKTCKKITLDPKLGKTHIFNLITDSRGNQWYCTTDGAFLKIKNEEILRHFDLIKISGSNSFSNEVVNIYESPEYGIGLLTNNGLFFYNYKSDKVVRVGFDKKKGDVLKSQDINSLHVDKDGIVWVGTWGGGLSKYNIKTGKIKTYTTKEGLPSMGIQGILPDEKNNALWLSTFNGISRFSIDQGQFNNFSMDDGIQGSSFADGSGVKTRGGIMLFGGNNGITVFNPNTISKNSTPPKVFITDFKIGDVSTYYGIDSIKEYKKLLTKDFILKYNQNSISINYTAIHYANTSRNKFSYRLENYDNNWREVGNVRTAYYYDLPPGEYIFKVKAANSNGVWNKAGTSVAFSITPPWWRTWWAYALYGIFFVVLVLLIDRFQRKRLLEKEHALAKEIELEHAREIEKAFNTLKTTQLQLIQSEKMASLGELTAGIAHEIQNPLNFVNNFSEVSSELLEEMNVEIEKGDFEEVKNIAGDIKQNLEKINHHGKRADAIVKGMLQHSRSSSGQKEPTNINALADEYLRLAYQGLRAKDKKFNATMKTEFDQTIDAINIIPQDMGRVILNLITNAFYAINEKQNSGIENYDPTITVVTKKLQSSIEIAVKDNGNGIQQKVLDKIFQPFFTTKPTGEGTGLGLSLSYDIVKAHGGELKVETKEGLGTTFRIQLPV